MSSYKHFTLEERKYLQELLYQGYSFRRIAKYLGRSPSSISREVKRNRSKWPRNTKTNNKYNYNPWRATIVTNERRKRHRRSAIPLGSDVYAYVVDKLKRYWSPEQISLKLKQEKRDSTLAFSTIYRYVKNKELPGIRARTHLRRRGKNRHYVHHNSNVIHPDRLIPEWPEEIKGRIRIGDWEGDTVYGGIGKGLVVTLVDRKSRFLRAAKIESRDSEETRHAIVRLLTGMPVSSISLDNGVEFAQFRELERDLDTLVYFAEPHKPWQRGTNENTNDQLRFFFPKGCNFKEVTDEELQEAVDFINDKPRKCLAMKSATEIFYESVALR